MADSFRTHRSCCWWCDHRTEKKLQVNVLVSQRCGQLAAGGGLFVAQPATELTVTRYLHFSGSSTCNLLVRLSQSIPVPCKLFGMHAIWNVGANTVNLMRRRRKVSVRKSSMNCWGTSVGVGERGQKLQGERGEKTRGGGENTYFRDIVHAAGVTLHDLPHQQAPRQQQQWRQFEDRHVVNIGQSQSNHPLPPS